MQSQLLMKCIVDISLVMKPVSTFKDVLALHRAIKNISFKCGEQSPKISIVDQQNDGYVIAVKKRCCLRCVRHFVESRKLSVDEDDNYLTIRTK